MNPLRIWPTILAFLWSVIKVCLTQSAFKTLMQEASSISLGIQFLFEEPWGIIETGFASTFFYKWRVNLHMWDLLSSLSALVVLFRKCPLCPMYTHSQQWYWVDGTHFTKHKSTCVFTPHVLWLTPCGRFFFCSPMNETKPAYIIC